MTATTDILRIAVAQLNPIVGDVAGNLVKARELGETAPPYDKPLRGVQVLMRVYEPDSRAIRQVRVNQHFMQE